ncbi:SCAN domain-containing protein 1-like [Monodelphis domestica]|uniref:SCAN domain-containing protein 1-like n=1 Tax=Monodelphis domestica TaxID=13616 RepID=UPI0024E24591|nr:SCAN domain-containing protein 1-like [Monodelphis domestica]XP_056681893.1 SCAN domain-containing protein 1-like [Monodelphis domestica]
MEGEGCSVEIGAETQDGQAKSSPNLALPEKPEVLVTEAAAFQAPLEEAKPLAMNREEDSIRDPDSAIPKSLQHRGAQEESFQRRFRGFRYEDAAGPQQLLQRLRELSRRWLDPDVHTKEQMIELLVQEQFQAVMPEELQTLVQRPKTDG